MLLLGFAESPPDSATTMLTLLGSLAILAVVTVLAAIPPLLARRRRHPAATPLAVACLLWALATAGLGLFLLFQRQQWTRENNILIQSGYYDPATAVPPSFHPLLWIILVAVYVMLAALPQFKRTKNPSNQNNDA